MLNCYCKPEGSYGKEGLDNFEQDPVKLVLDGVMHIYPSVPQAKQDLAELIRERRLKGKNTQIRYGKLGMTPILVSYSEIWSMSRSDIINGLFFLGSSQN